MENFTYISYGAGVQSTALLVMSALQIDRYPCPKADIAVFADTGDEPQWVYDTLGYYDEHFSDRIPIIRVRKGNRMTREDCKRFLDSLDLPVPRKSSCVFCPFHSDAYWRDLRDNYPQEFAKAISMDETIRDMSKRGMNAPMFLHRSLKPLSKVKFNHED